MREPVRAFAKAGSGGIQPRRPDRLQLGGDQPDKPCCLYADNPVCDIRSWPEGFAHGPGSADDWERGLAVYGVDAESASDFDGNPVDRVEPIVRHGIPLLHVCGDADELVPHFENTGALAERIRDHGGKIELIMKPGAKHHSHSLEDPESIVQFILGAWEDVSTHDRRPKCYSSSALSSSATAHS